MIENNPISQTGYIPTRPSQAGSSNPVETKVTDSREPSSQHGRGLTVVLAVGPNIVGPENTLTDPLKGSVLETVTTTIQQKLLGAQFLAPGFTVDNIEALKKSVNQDNRILYIFLAHGRNNNGSYEIQTEDGWVSNKQFSDAIRNHNAEVILVTCHSGAFNLSTVPSTPVFGASPAEEPGSMGYFMRFVNEINANGRPFPTTAESMYDAWHSNPRIKPQLGPLRSWWGFHSASGGKVVGMKNIPRDQHELFSNTIRLEGQLWRR